MTDEHAGVAPAPGRRAWRRLGRPAALSPAVTYLFAPIGLTGPLLVDRARLGGSLGIWLLIGGLGQLTVMACFAVGRRVVHPPGRTASRPMATLAVVIVATILRGIVIGAGARIAGLAHDLELGYRVALSLPLIGGTLVVAALLVSAQAEHRRLVEQLRAQRAELELLDASMQGRLAEIRERLLRQVRTSLEPGLVDLRRAIDAVSDGADPSDHLGRLRSFVDTDVRELSRSILAATDQPDPGHRAADAGTSTTLRWPRRIPVRRCLRPLTQGVLIAIAALPSAFRDLPVTAALVWAASLGTATGCGIWLVRALLARWEPRLPVAVTTATVTGAVATSGAVYVIAASGVASPRLVAGPAFVVGAGLGLFFAVYAALEAGRTQVEQELAVTVDRLRESVSALRQRTWIARRRLSLLVHGTIQSVIHAAVLRLTTMTSADPAVLEGVRRDVEAAMGRLDEVPADSIALSRTLTEIAETWDGVCTVSWSMSEPAVAVLDADIDRCECAAEIAREGVHNAIVHGRATLVDVRITRVGDRIVVRVNDNGTTADGPPGLGSQMLDDMCVEWIRTTTSAGTTLDARLSLA